MGFTFNESDHYDEKGRNKFDGSYNKKFDNRVTAGTSEVKKGSVSKWLKKVDGQDEDGQGGGRLSKASDVFSKLAQNTPGSVHRGVDYNKNVSIREGASKNELAQSDEIGNYDAWLKRQDKEKKANSNYA